MKRRRRLSDTLSASELMRRDADDWQVMHAILNLYRELVRRRLVRGLDALDDRSTLHSFVHTRDLRLGKWKPVLIYELEQLEAKL